MSTYCTLYRGPKTGELPPYLTFHDPVLSPFIDSLHAMDLAPDITTEHFDKFVRQTIEKKFFPFDEDDAKWSNVSIPVTEEAVKELYPVWAKHDKFDLVYSTRTFEWLIGCVGHHILRRIV